MAAPRFHCSGRTTSNAIWFSSRVRKNVVRVCQVMVKVMAMGEGMNEGSSCRILHAPVYPDGGRVGLSVY